MAKVEAKKLVQNAGTNSLLYGMIAVGVASFLFGLFRDAGRIWYSFLLYHSLFLGFGIGGIFFIVVHYLSSSGWIVAVRRVLEAMASYVGIAFLLNIVLLFGLKKIYPWTDHEFMMSEHVLQGKMGYFSTAFYSIRTFVFYGILTYFTYRLIGNSVKQDIEGGVARTDVQKKYCALFLVFFAPAFTVFSVDLIKSLDPAWFSTMWGVYVFIGYVQAAVAAAIVIIRRLQKHGYMHFVTADHFHDLGKYLFGFTVFWAYIAVSQYLLIWYANLPEETTFFIRRQNPGWLWVSILLPFVRFIIPFLALLPRMAKRNSAYLEKVAYLVLFSAWIDLNWQIMPIYSPNGFKFGWQDIGIFLGFLGVFAVVVRAFLTKNSTLPVKDPYLHETLHHHVM